MKRCLYALLALAAAAHAAPLRDPFARPAAAAPATPAPTEPRPQLRAIMFAPGHSLANIGGQILAVGDWFGDYRIVKIEERRVTIERRGVATVLALDEERAK